MTDRKQTAHEAAVDAALWDIACAISHFSKTDPFAEQRYLTDPAFQAEVHEWVRLARAMADKAKATKLQNLLHSEAARRQYETDELFRAQTDCRATKAAIEAVEADAAAESNATKH